MTITLKSASPSRQSTFLIVEDRYLARRAMARALRSAGHLVTEAEDGDTALCIALSSRHDAIVLDLALPGKSGFGNPETIAGGFPRAHLVRFSSRFGGDPPRGSSGGCR